MRLLQYDSSTMMSQWLYIVISVYYFGICSNFLRWLPPHWKMLWVWWFGEQNSRHNTSIWSHSTERRFIHRFWQNPLLKEFPGFNHAENSLRGQHCIFLCLLSLTSEFATLRHHSSLKLGGSDFLAHGSGLRVGGAVVHQQLSCKDCAANDLTLAPSRRLRVTFTSSNVISENCSVERVFVRT